MKATTIGVAEQITVVGGRSAAGQVAFPGQVKMIWPPAARS